MDSLVKLGLLSLFFHLNLGLTAFRAFLKTSVGSEIFKITPVF